jgi:hypothetical protein
VRQYHCLHVHRLKRLFLLQPPGSTLLSKQLNSALYSYGKQWNYSNQYDSKLRILKFYLISTDSYSAATWLPNRRHEPRNVLQPPSPKINTHGKTQRCQTLQLNTQFQAVPQQAAHYSSHVRKTTAKSAYQLRRASLSAWNNPVTAGRIFVQFYVAGFYQNRENSSFLKTGERGQALYMITYVYLFAWSVESVLCEVRAEAEETDDDLNVTNQTTKRAKGHQCKVCACLHP